MTLITISGSPGAGKTTLARALARRLGAAFVEYDRYETFTRQPPQAVQRWLQDGADLDALRAPGLHEALDAALRRGTTIVDAPFGGLHAEIRGRATIGVWIDLPLDIALARKIAQLSAGVPKGRDAAFRTWLSGYLAAYQGVVREAALMQANRVRPESALVVHGTDPVAHNTARIADLLSSGE